MTPTYRLRCTYIYSSSLQLLNLIHLSSFRFDSGTRYTIGVMKLLIVEDERKIARALKLGFAQERMQADLYEDGQSGLAAALADEYDAIILDRMLPGGMDGMEICSKLRGEGIKTPILLLTAKGQIRDRVAGLNAGADDYLVKPFSFEELLARVRALMRRPGLATESILRVADLTLDPVSKQVKRGASTLDLSATEYALLEYLMRNENRVLSKTTIINHVWDFDADVLPNTVEAYIGYLRTKIDRAFPKAKPLIHTMRGFGYKLAEES